MLMSASKIAMASLLTLAAVWALVLGWWQTNEYSPPPNDLLLYLGGLPLMLIAGFWLLYGFIEHLKAPAPSPLEAGGNPGASATSQDLIRESERRPQLRLIGDWIISSDGNSAEELLEAMQAGKRPQLDPSLRDRNGFPVFAARIDDLPVETPTDSPAEGADGDLDSSSAEEDRRTISLLEMVLPEALECVQEFIQPPSPPTKLVLLWLVPEAFASFGVQRLTGWLRGRYLQSLPTDSYELHVRVVKAETDTLQAVDELLSHSMAEPQTDHAYLIFGATSAIGEATIDAWDNDKQLFKADQQSGKIPGEAVACLLLHTSPATAATVQDGAAVLSRVHWALRDKPADGPGRVCGKAVARLLDDVLANCEIDPGQVRAFVTDGDHRASRIGELHAALDDRFEAIDPINDCNAVGITCGSVMAIAPLIALSCSRAKAGAAGGPVVYVSQHDPVTRAAMLITPLNPDADADAS